VTAAGEVSAAMRVLVICGDHYHPAAVVRAGLAPLTEEGYQFDWIEDARDWSVERMAPYPAVLFAKSDAVSSTDRNPWLTDEVQRAFHDYARRGGGIVFVHAGTAGMVDLPVMRALIGGAFAHHPPRCPVTVIPQPGAALAEGCVAFTLEDEHYHMLWDDAGARAFAWTRSQHGVQPGGWWRLEGQGRVAVLTPGHVVEVWLHPSFQTLLRNALRWCAGAG
jgi:type 1 glutamine amidotransferase